MTPRRRHCRARSDALRRATCLTPLAARRLLLAVALSACAFAAHAGGHIAPDLERALKARGTHADTAVIVRFRDPVAFDSFEVTDRRARDTRLLGAMKERAARNRAAFEPQLVAQRAKRIRDLWIVNGLSATVPAVAVRRFAESDLVERIELDSFVQTGRAPRASAASPLVHRDAQPALVAAPGNRTGDPALLSGAVPSWNVAAVHAPELWARGHTGRGVVVAMMDTGADLAHPNLRRTWRGGTNSWFDPHAEEPLPKDAVGHGTQALGVVLGARGLGVAPEARWIAVRLYDSAGRARMSDIHLAFQWLMDPDGDPATVDAPDIVNASWSLAGRPPGTCIADFADDVRALRSSGIAVVFAAGNDGPAARTSSSPANNPGALSVGALDRDLTIARGSSRGPSSCDGAVFPRVVAPGTNVRTADLSHGGPAAYGNVSGSSLASPHVAGVLALLMSAFPSASVAALETALERGAADLGDAGPDNLYGHGLVDALGAFNVLTANQEAARPSGAVRSLRGGDAPAAEPRSERDRPTAGCCKAATTPAG